MLWLFIIPIVALCLGLFAYWAGVNADRVEKALSDDEEHDEP